MREPDWVVGKHNGRAIRGEFGQQRIGFTPRYVSIRYSNNINKVIFKLHGQTFIPEDSNVVTLQSVCHGTPPIIVVMVAEDGETAKRRCKAREDRRYGVWWHPTTPEWLHVDVVAAEQRDVRDETRRFSDDCGETCNVASMRTGMKIGQKCNAHGPRPARPPGNLRVKMANDVRLGAADPVEPALVTEVITKRGTRDGSNQATS